MKEENNSVHAECPKHEGQPEIACVECKVEKKQYKYEYEEREEFFKKHGIKCSCLIGYAVCENCHNYYNTKGWKEKRMSIEESARYHIVCARATLYPGKSIDEVNEIVDELLEKCRKI